MKKIAIFPSIVALALCFSGCGNDELEKVALKSISISPTPLTLLENETAQLTASPKPANADDVSFHWSSSDSTVAAVSQTGLVSAIKEGQAVLTVESGDVRKMVQVTVSSIVPRPLTDIDITAMKTTLGVGEKLTLTSKPVPASAIDYVPVWSVSEGKNFVKVSPSGEVTALAPGLAAVKVKSGDIEKSIVITVLGARTAKNLSTKGGGAITIEWNADDISNGTLYMEVAYTGLDGTEKTVQTAATEKFTNIADYRSNLRYRTAYSPETELILTAYQEEKGYFYFDKTKWKILSYSSQLPDLPATNAINGNTTGDFTDRWHTNAPDEKTGAPSVTIDLGAEATLARFAVWPSYEPQKLPPNVRFEVSKDNITWTNLGEYACDNTANVIGARFFDVTPTPARYYRWTGWTIYWMAVGELDVYCK